jgi:hypothetical protein
MNNKILRLKIDLNPDPGHTYFNVMLPHGHRLLAFGPDRAEDFPATDPYIDVILDTDIPQTQWAQRRFIVLPVGAQGISENLVNYRQMLGSFVAPNGKQCYVFEGGMVGV